MSANNKIKKQIKANSLRFIPDMYTSYPGSIVICGYMFAEEKPKIKIINKTWKKYQKKHYDFGLSVEDPEYFEKLLKLFDLPMFDLNNVAFVQSQFNALIAPYINGNLLPLREDGLYTLTLRKGKIYPLVNKQEKKENA